MKHSTTNHATTAEKPDARAVPATKVFKIGPLMGQIVGTSPDFLEPMAEDERALWESGDCNGHRPAKPEDGG